MEKIYKLLWMLSCKFVTKKVLNDEFAAFAINYMFDELKMDQEDIKDILKIIKEEN